MNDDRLFGQTVAQFRANLILLDRFQLHGILGRSPICLTWLATEKRAQRFVGLKFIAEPIRQFPEHLEDLDRASRLVRSLKHKNIAAVYEFVVTHEWAAFSVEAVDGETLAQMVAKEPYGVFDIAKLSSYVTEVCLALHYAHDQGVIHDDIKPSNIMRMADGGHIKVTDFHIGRAINSAAANVVRRLTPPEQLSQNDFILRHGTIEALKFMSPQRAYGIEPTPVDDIYSLGATIYFLLTGSLPVRPEHLLNPIEATTPVKMSLKLRENGIRNRFIPASWDATIAACLERKHQNRPQSILEFAYALDLDLGIPYIPPKEDKASTSSTVEVASHKEQAPSDLPAFKFPASYSKHPSEQPFFVSAPTHASSVPSETESINASQKVGFYGEAETSRVPSNHETENLTSKTIPHPQPTAQTTQPAPSSVSPPLASTEKKSTQAQENHQPPNFSRGPRSAPPPSPTKQEEGNKAEIHASATAVSTPPTSDPFASTPPRPAAYTPPPTSAKPSHQTDADWAGVSYSSSPFPDEPSDQMDEFRSADTSSSSKTKAQGAVEEPLPYEEIDEKDFRTSAPKQSRKTSHRSDPSNQRSRYAQRTRSASHDHPRTNNFNPPPPYAYQQQATPPPSSATPSGIPTQKIRNWQRNLVKVLLALFIFYACVFTIWFGLAKLGLLPEENYISRITQLFKKNPKEETIASTQAAIPVDQYAYDSPTTSQFPPATAPPLPPPNTAYQPSPSPSTPRPEDTSPPLTPPPAPPILPQPPVEVQPQDHGQQPNQEMAPAPPPPPVVADVAVSTNSVTSITGPAKIVPDEYLQIQAAIDAASPGETIRIKSGVYTENIIFKEGIKLIGEGMDVVTLQCPPTSPAIDIRNIQNGLIEGITIKHTEMLNSENTPPLINITNSNVEITRCRIQNSSGTGIHIANGSRAVIRQNIIENNNLFGISVMDPGTVPIIERNQINNNQRVGLVFSNGASGTATGNIIKENQWDGIAVLNPATNPTIQQNITIENQRRGIFFAKGAGGIAEGNTSERNKMNGISILDEGTAPVISNNRVSSNELRGIHFGKGAKGIARGNISENNGDIGILIVDEGTRPELHNNTARNNEGWGIAIAQEALPPPSSGNIARGNKQGQINFEQTR